MGSRPQIARPRDARRRTWRALILSFVLPSFVLLASCKRTPPSEVWIIGLDGADWDILNPLIDTGKLPNLAALRDQSAWGVLLSDEPMLSPILWTSIATGKTADQHGVTWFMTDAPDGSKIPVSSRDRRVRALWNIASENDLDVGVVGWWATWPAEPVRGFIVSDYVAWHSFGVSGRRMGTQRTTHPDDLSQTVADMIPAPENVNPALMQRMFHLPPATGALPEPVEHIRQAIATTEGYTDIALRLIDESRPSLLAVYYEGTDAAEHLFMNCAPPQLPWVSDQDFAAYKDVVSEYWRWQDEQLGRILAKRGENTAVVVVSDHGFRHGGERLKEEEFKIELADASHLPDGIIMISGPGVRAGARINGADVYDVAPTVLHLLDLPVAADFSGEPITGIFTEAWTSAHAVQQVRTFETGPWERGPDVAVDPSAGKSMEKMLTSLGYVSATTVGAADKKPDAGAVEQKVNMAVVLRRQNKLEEARRMLEQVLKEHPGHVSATSNLARVYAEAGDLARAEKIYRELVRAYPSDVAHYEDLANTLVRQGKHREARNVYEDGLAVDAHWTIGLVGKANAVNELGDSETALSLIDKALAQNPKNADGHYARGLILSKSGRHLDAAVALERALESDPDHLEAAIALSNVKDRLGDSSGALAAAENAKQYHPDDARLAAQTGALHLKLGHMRKAAAELEKASATLEDPVVLGNYGTAQAALGDVAGAAETFARAVKLDPDSHEALATLGQLYLRMGRFNEAEDMLARAIRLQPGDAKIQFALGVVYDMTGRLDLAKKQYQTAINIDDSVGVFYYQLGKVYGRQGKEEQAVDLLEKGRELDPGLPPPGGDAGSTSPMH